MGQPSSVRRLTRPAALLLVGALAGTFLLHPALAALPTSFKKLVKKLEKKLDPRYVSEDQVFTRHASCPGVNFYPVTNDFDYQSDGILQYGT